MVIFYWLKLNTAFEKKIKILHVFFGVNSNDAIPIILIENIVTSKG